MVKKDPLQPSMAYFVLCYYNGYELVHEVLTDRVHWGFLFDEMSDKRDVSIVIIV